MCCPCLCPAYFPTPVCQAHFRHKVRRPQSHWGRPAGFLLISPHSHLYHLSYLATLLNRFSCSISLLVKYSGFASPIPALVLRNYSLLLTGLRVSYSHSLSQPRLLRSPIHRYPRLQSSDSLLRTNRSTGLLLTHTCRYEERNQFEFIDHGRRRRAATKNPA